ncbi:hypothetical protein BDV10DRAFT_199813 [Aspergillus recurvatus]
MAALTVAAYLLAFIITAAILYNQATSKIPSRLNAGQAPRSVFGIVEVKKNNLGSHPRAGGVDVVFVHGLGSNPDTTWSAKTKQQKSPSEPSDEYICWVTDFLPDDIPSPEREEVRLFFYNYDSYWQRDAVQVRLRELGGDMLHRLGEIRKTAQERERYLVFVGHSYGGLVIKEALVQANQNLEYHDVITHTKAILFLGTPHRGSNFSRWGKTVAGLLSPLSSNSSILGELTYDSLSLQDLHDNFTKAVKNVQSITNFYEQRKSRILKVWWFQWEEFCVQQQSATFPDLSTKLDNIGLGTDHYGLNKFESRNGNYNLILKELQKIIKPVVSQLQHSWYSVPIRPVRSYTERPSLSEEIHTKLRQSTLNRRRPYSVAICGPGGAGKTQLALKFIEDHKSKFNPILWIDAESQETALLSFERCASELQIQNQPLGQWSRLRDSPTVQAVRRWLQRRDKLDDEWLVIFDNVDNLAWNVVDILPEGERGNIIVTSQDERASERLGYERVSVDVMSPIEARGVLLWHLSRGHQLSGQDIEELCDEVAERLEYLPLAIDLAGAYMENENKADPQSTLTRYLNKYRKYQNELLQIGWDNTLSSYEKTVWTVWDTTLQRIEEKYPGQHSKLLLIFLAHFQSRFIEDELFRLASLGLPFIQHDIFADQEELPHWLQRILSIDGDQWAKFHYEEALKPLVSYGLLRPVQGTWPGVRLHSLVQWRAMQYKEDHYHIPWNTCQLKLVIGACHSLLSDTGKPHFRRHIAVHIPQNSQSSVGLIGEEGRSKMWDMFGLIYFGEGRWEEAEAMHKQALEGREKALGPEHPSTLASFSHLGIVLDSQGKYEAAEAIPTQSEKV